MRDALLLALLVGLVLAPMSGGCGADLPSGVLLDRPRVLAVRVDIEGDSARAQPRPGEMVTLRWLVDGSDAWVSAITACVAAPANRGIPSCAGAPFAFAPPGAPTADPVLTMTLPDASAFAAGGDVVVLGVLCADGVPSTTEDGLPTCDGEGATTELLTFSFPVALGDAPANLHPSLTDETTSIDELAWAAPPDDLPTSGCAARPSDAALPHLVRTDEESPSTVQITTSADDREAYARVILGEDGPMLEEAREDLTITHVATAGQYARLQTVIYDEALPNAEVLWRHPAIELVPADGLTVRFVFVVRDGRGGMDWIRRAVCIEP